MVELIQRKSQIANSRIVNIVNSLEMSSQLVVAQIGAKNLEISLGPHMPAALIKAPISKKQKWSIKFPRGLI